MNKLPLYIADLQSGEDKMLALSFVAQPATGLHAKIVERTDTHTIIFAPILPANTPIYRKNSTYGEHYVLFLPDVIRDAMGSAYTNRITFDVEHSGKPLEGVGWIESYQIDYAKSKLYRGYQGLPDGTWVGLFSIPMGGIPSDGDMVFTPYVEKSQHLDKLGISISGIFSYERLPLSDAIEIYNKLNIL